MANALFPFGSGKDHKILAGDDLLSDPLYLSQSISYFEKSVSFVQVHLFVYSMCKLYIQLFRSLYIVSSLKSGVYTVYWVIFVSAKFQMNCPLILSILYFKYSYIVTLNALR